MCFCIMYWKIFQEGRHSSKTQRIRVLRCNYTIIFDKSVRTLWDLCCVISISIFNLFCFTINYVTKHVSKHIMHSYLRGTGSHHTINKINDISRDIFVWQSIGYRFALTLNLKLWSSQLLLAHLSLSLWCEQVLIFI